MMHKVGANLQCQGFHASIVTLVCTTSENRTKKIQVLFYFMFWSVLLKAYKKNKTKKKRLNDAQIKCKLALSRFFMLALCRLVSSLSVQRTKRNQILFYVLAVFLIQSILKRRG